MTIAIGIDVGGTKIAGGVVDDAGAIIARRTIPTQATDAAACVTGIVKVVRELAAGAPAATAVGVGAAGLVDVERGVVLSAPNIAWRDLPLRSTLAGRLGLPVTVDNDANAAALGEARFGAGRDAGDQIMITLGTGVGGGMVRGGVLYRGGLGRGAEIGHVVIAGPDGPPCACGARGCFEAVASGNALGRMAKERAGDPGAAGVLARASGDAAGLTGEIVGEAALAGDDFAAGLVAEAGRWLGIGIVGLVNLLDPEIVIVGGGAGRLGELILAPARAELAGSIVGGDRRDPPPIVPAALGPDAGIVGAAELARQDGLA